MIYFVAKTMFRKKKLCVRCGTEGYSKKHVSGSFIIELVLFMAGLIGLLFFIIPGLIVLALALAYSIWRLTTKKQVCRACGSEDLIPPDSPAAIALRREFSARDSAV
jgi:ribosomal protein S27AE